MCNPPQRPSNVEVNARRGNDLVVDRKTHDGEDRGNRGEVELESSEGEE